MYSFCVARNTISLIISEVCQAFVEEYKDEVITYPTTPEEWTPIEEVFRNRWNVLHAVGALDGKHGAIRKPANYNKSGSLYHNYKGFFSVGLMALVDGDYKFLWVDISAYGSMSDAQIFNESELKDCLEDRSIGFPEPWSPIPLWFSGRIWSSFQSRVAMITQPLSESRIKKLDGQVHNFPISEPEFFFETLEITQPPRAPW